MNTLQLLGALEIGLIYALVAIAIYITFRIIDFPDLTVDGSFTLGAAIATSMIISGSSPLMATLAAILGGAAAGYFTGYLNVRWNILGLLASILTMTALYSINLRIMERPNLAIIDEPTIFAADYLMTTIIAVVISVGFLLAWFFNTEIGLAIRAVGINPKTSRAYGINVGISKIVALMISNGVVALAGAMFAQSQGFADISMGTGTIIIGLASLIIGEAVFHPKRILLALFACICGSIIFRIAISIALNTADIGLEASDLNLITVLLVLIAVIVPKLRKGRA